jgi:hypothetical protein
MLPGIEKIPGIGDRQGLLTEKEEFKTSWEWK